MMKNLFLPKKKPTIVSLLHVFLKICVNETSSKVADLDKYGIATH